MVPGEKDSVTTSAQRTSSMKTSRDPGRARSRERSSFPAFMV